MHAAARSSAAHPSRGASGAAPAHLIIGPVGAGKSTFAVGLARERGAVRFTLDEWMTSLFSPDRPTDGIVEWYVERASRCVDRIWELAKSVLEAGTPVVLEIGLLERSQREAFYDRVARAGIDLTIHVVDAERTVRRARVLERNRTKGETFSMIVPLEVFELASDLWEPPHADECAAHDVRFVFTDPGADG